MNNIRTFGLMLAAAAGIAGFNAYAGEGCEGSQCDLTRKSSCCPSSSSSKECCQALAPKVCCPRCDKQSCSCKTSSSCSTGCCPTKEIVIGDLSDTMQNGDVLVVNVLARESFDDCHIAGSISVPLAELKEAAVNWDKSQKIVTYCAHSECTASGAAADVLTELGFEDVQAYEGGIKEWLHSGLPTEGPAEQDWLKA